LRTADSGFAEILSLSEETTLLLLLSRVKPDESAVEIIRTRYSWELIVDEYEKLFTRVLENKQS
jgi:hypothetical protein